MVCNVLNVQINVKIVLVILTVINVWTATTFLIQNALAVQILVKTTHAVSTMDHVLMDVLLDGLDSDVTRNAHQLANYANSLILHV